MGTVVGDDEMRPLNHPGWVRELPSFPHSRYNEPLMELFEFYKENVKRDVADGKLRPPDFWFLLRGLLIGAAQTYAAICILLADGRPKPLELQAGVLNRSLLESLGNVLALCEAPKARTKVFLREAYKSLALDFRRLDARYGKVAKWRDYLTGYGKVLQSLAEQLHLSRSRVNKPDAIPDWPTPGVMVYGSRRRQQPPFLRGNRRVAFKEIYDHHYGRQSGQAHQRGFAVATALLVDDPNAPWSRTYGKSRIVASAMIFLACILSEIESKGRYDRHRELRKLWVEICRLDDLAKDLWRLRYRKLIGA